MLKRRFLHREDWSRIIKRTYKEKEINDNDFVGYIALIQMHEVSQPLIKKI